ncbi:MAG TPA: NAD-dependent epimerase/dehydratase family protein [Stellaceae bacterium]|jgi:UDP-glucuronate 4-epimerase|nr:NAD-dependent epimerase/dehydratase family protein [Stellaceae bacterium]
MSTLITGVAGFIGYHVAQRLLNDGEDVIGVDNLNNYYDVGLKSARLSQLTTQKRFRFFHCDVSDFAALSPLTAANPDIDNIIHLAAQAGVRHSLIDPFAYITANVMGHLTVLEAARRLSRLRHIVYASSSSVYGGNTKLPFSESDRVDTPLSVYAATKRADELLSHAYGHLHGLPQTGLRFFTVYGPWGRPDMAYFSFARAIVAGTPITLYGRGELRRDFTYIDDIVDGVLRSATTPPTGSTPLRILNIGNNNSERVIDLVEFLEKHLNRKAVIIYAECPPTEVPETFADIDAIKTLAGFAPTTPLSQGIPRFVEWFRSYYAWPNNQ